MCAGHEAVFPTSVMKNKDTFSTAQKFIQVCLLPTYIYVHVYICTCRKYLGRVLSVQMLMYNVCIIYALGPRKSMQCATNGIPRVATFLKKYAASGGT